MTERELGSKVSLVTRAGRLNPDAVGWARRPELVDTSGLTRRPGRTWGRTKRWEYWNVISPTHILALTVSNIDYAAVHEVWIFDRASGQTWGTSVTQLISTSPTELPRDFGGPARARAKGLNIEVTPTDDGTRLRAQVADAAFDISVHRPASHDCLAVVVPWSDKRFQYTVKDVALPAAGTLTVDGVRHDVADGSWAVLDHGRGRWPYNVRWNWAAASGITGRHTFGLQLGGKWTDGTGTTENGLVVDGHLHKIHEDLTWDYDPADYLRPWRVTGGGLDATLIPFYNKASGTNLGVVSSRTAQCFGTWSGTYESASGRFAFEGLVGFAEDVHNRW